MPGLDVPAVPGADCVGEQGRSRLGGRVVDRDREQARLKPPGSVSTVWSTRVPPSTDSKTQVIVTGNGAAALTAYLRFASYSVTWESASNRRRNSLLVVW
jgi:hypothetical protein